MSPLETQRRLVRAVRELDEPYRTVIVLRIFRELTPARIANRLGVPVKTVHTRIRRALERLRTSLDRSASKTGAGWRASLALLLSPEAELALPAATLPAAGATMGVALMTTAQKVFVGVAAAVLLATGWVVLETLPDAPSPDDRASRGEYAWSDGGGETDVGAEAEGDSSLPGWDDGLPFPVEGGPRWKLDLTVSDELGSPCVGARVATLNEYEVLTGTFMTDGHGRVEVGVRGVGRIGVDAWYRAPLRLPDMAPPESGRRATHVTATMGRTIEGMVLDRHGDPIPADQPVTVRAEPLRVNPWFRSDRAAWTVRTGKGGRFRIPQLNDERFQFTVSAPNLFVGRSPSPAVEGDADGGSVIIKLQPVPGIVLRLVDASTGRPVTTRARMARDQGPAVGRASLPDPAGRVFFESVPFTPTVYRMRADGYRPSAPLERLVEGRPTTTVRVIAGEETRVGAERPARR